MALTLVCSVPSSLHDCVIRICLPLLLLSAATTTHPTTATVLQMPAGTSDCHLIQPPSKNCSEAIQKTSLPYPNGSKDTLRGEPIQLPTEHHKTTAGSIQKLNTGQKYKTTVFLDFEEVIFA